MQCPYCGTQWPDDLAPSLKFCGACGRPLGGTSAAPEQSTGISGVEFEESYASKIVDTLDGVQVNIIDLPHLKANKKSRWSPERPR